MTTPEPSADQLLAAARASAASASEIISQGWKDRAVLKVHEKGAGDLVTSIDHAAEAAAIGVIRDSFPQHAILAEESGQSGHSDYLWVIDPLDGSVNFAHGLPHFAVSIACLIRGTPVAGVIVDPLRGEVFSARRGGGAWLDDKRLAVSDCNDLQRALLATVFPKPGSALLTTYTPGLVRALNCARGVRRSGSMVLDLAYLASGRIDGFWQTGMKAWDLAAGTLLVEEAGGLVELSGGAAPTILSASACIAAPPDLITALRQLVTPREAPPA